MKHKKGLTIDECVKRAEKFIASQGICLLLYDIKGSRKMYNRENIKGSLNLTAEEFAQKIEYMKEILNTKFSEYMPENNLRIGGGKLEKGFQIYRGDSAVAGINSAEIIPEIVNYQKQMFPDIPLYWSVAKDLFDHDAWL